MTGRGTWPIAGTGGTLDFAKVNPGPYYTKGIRIPLGANDPDPNRRAVFGAIKAIQEALNRHRVDTDPVLAVDGWFGEFTETAVTHFQILKQMNPWGGVGPETARALLIDDVRKWADWSGMDYDWAVTGLIYQESDWDPGAVGYQDSRDLGLAQINGAAHPDLTEQERLDPKTAAQFVAAYLQHAIAYFHNIRDAIASYNLGFSGTSLWIHAGRPTLWTPPGSTTERNIKGYIDNVFQAPRT